MTNHPAIHPATPRKLKTEFKRADYKYHRLAKARGVNVKYVHDLIHYGKEPSNENLRKKLFLPKKSKRRFSGCRWCGKLIELTRNGVMTSHSHPDGTYCKGVGTRDFLSSTMVRKPSREKAQHVEPAEEIKWWRTLDKDRRHKYIRLNYQMRSYE